MDSLPTFPLFPDPIHERVFKKSNALCGICHQARGVLYEGPKYGTSAEVEKPICPWCIADGNAGRHGVEFNDALVALSAEERELVAQRTPGYVTWQGNRWLVCCGRACVYLGEADAADLQGRWAGAVPSMFQKLKWSDDRIAEVVSRIEREGSPAAYIFQCRVCNGLRGYWDQD